MSKHHYLSGLLGLLLSAPLALAADAGAAPDLRTHQTLEGVSPTAQTQGMGLKSREDLEAFLDGVMAAHMRAQHMAGAVVTVVKDGEIFLSKGYGFADLEKKIPVNADKTLFRPGSVSKLFTWTALMQLVEQGKIGLDDDVNKYLKQFQVPDTYPGTPITIRNLFTHTEGMEDGGLGYLLVDKPELLEDPAKVLEERLPARVRAPASGDFTDGRMSSYSNWGTALAGLIIANVSGMSFDDYLDKNVLAPLGMTQATARQPLPEAIAADMSVGYAYKDSAHKAEGFEYVNMAPAGSMSVSGTDMGKFMIAHLQKGAYKDARILTPEGAALMHSRILSPSPYTNGAALGFYENFVNGHRLIVHGGDLQYFHSEMNLLIDQNVGIFVSFNTEVVLPFSTRIDLLRAFMQRYYPASLPDVKAPEDFKDRVANYAGEYRIIRHSYTTYEKLFSIISSLKVIPTERNTLISSFGPYTFELVEVKPNVFRRVDQDDMVAFAPGPDGRAEYILNPISLPNHTAYRLAWYETPAMLMVFAGLAVLGFLIALVSLVRNWSADHEAAPRRARRLLGLLAVVQLGFLGVVTGLVVLLTENPFTPLPGFFKAGLVLPVLALPLTLLALWFALSAWRGAWWTLYGRIQYSLIALAAALYLWTIHYANLLGWNLT